MAVLGCFGPKMSAFSALKMYETLCDQISLQTISMQIDQNLIKIDVKMWLFVNFNFSDFDALRFYIESCTTHSTQDLQEKERDEWFWAVLRW